MSRLSLEEEKKRAKVTQIYLISPPKIDLKSFCKDLNVALKTNLVPVFQLRLKDCNKAEIVKISKELQKICNDNNCLFILNDDYELAFELGASGVHLGLEDGAIKKARQKSPKDFIIGASCYDSRHLAMRAGEEGADYISYGAFFPSVTKKSRGNPTSEIIKWTNEIMNLPIVAIGGIDDKNCSSLVSAGADFVAVISYVWQNPLGIEIAIKNLARKI